MNLENVKATGVKMAINQYFSDIGEVSELDIDPDANHVLGYLWLKGEPNQTRLEIDYRMESENLVLEKFQCDRTWVENLLNRYVAGMHIKLNNSMVQGVVKNLL